MQFCFQIELRHNAVSFIFVIVIIAYEVNDVEFFKTSGVSLPEINKTIVFIEP